MTATTTPLRSGGLLRVQPVAPEPDKKAVKLRGYGYLITFFLRPYLLMIGMGVAHTYWPEVPAPGYWTTMLLALAVNEVASMFRDTRSRWWDK